MKQECNHISTTFSSNISRSILWPFPFLIMDFIFTVFICNGIIPDINNSFLSKIYTKCFLPPLLVILYLTSWPNMRWPKTHACTKEIQYLVNIRYHVAESSHILSLVFVSLTGEHLQSWLCRRWQFRSCCGTPASPSMRNWARHTAERRNAGLPRSECECECECAVYYWEYVFNKSI